MTLEEFEALNGGKPRTYTCCDSHIGAVEDNEEDPYLTWYNTYYGGEARPDRTTHLLPSGDKEP